MEQGQPYDVHVLLHLPVPPMIRAGTAMPSKGTRCTQLLMILKSDGSYYV